MIARRLTLVTFASLSLLAGALVYSCAAASAAITHEYERSITAIPAEPGVALPGPMSEANAMTVDAGKLYVAERIEGTTPRASRIDLFDDATGVFLAQFPQVASLSELGLGGIAVGHSTGEQQVYAGANMEGKQVLAVFDASGNLIHSWDGSDTPAGSFGDVGSVAADNSTSPTDWAAGNVYVTDPRNGVVDVFRPKAGGGEEYVTRLTGTEEGAPFENPILAAVDQLNGDVVVVDDDVVDVFEPTAFGQYTLIRQLTGIPGGPFQAIEGFFYKRLAVDGSTGEIYVAESKHVYEFSEVGEFLGELTGTPTRAFENVGGLTVDSATHRLYVGERGIHETSVYIFGGNVVIPDVTTGPVSALGPTSVTLNGTVNPDKAGEATCQFVWGATTVFGATVPCSASVAEGESPVPVQATLSGLSPDTTYHYRLQASNAHGTNPGQAYQDGEFTTLGVGIREEWAANAASSSVTLGAKIDPNGAATSYYFQYGTDTNYGAQEPLAPGASVGAGTGDVEVGQHVQSLQPATTYHYRVVALSELAPGDIQEFDGPDHTFTTQIADSVATLPDGRAWEMVSPPQKEGSLIEPPQEEGVIQAAAQGDAMTYLAGAPTEASPQGYTAYVQVLSTRGPDGWRTQDLALPHAAATGAPVGKGFEYRYFSSDLSLAAVQPFGAFESSLSPQASEQTAYLHADFPHESADEPCEANCYTPLVTGKAGAANVPPGTVFGGEEGGECHEHAVICGPEFVAATPDLNHVIIGSRVALSALPGDEGGLYEWTAGRLAPVGVLPGEQHAREAKLGGGESLTGQVRSTRHAVSDDGARVIWTLNGALYLTDVASGHSVQLDANQGGTGEGNASSVFQTASSNGDTVFFTDEQSLTPGSGAARGSADLYECEITEPAGQPKCALTDLTPEMNSEPAGVQGLIPGASEDGSYVYFVADGVLAQGAVPGQCGVSPPPGATCNLYERHDGVTELVAVLSAKDHPDWVGSGGELNLSELTARVSPDGRWLAFMSQRDLTGYDTNAAAGGGPSEEVNLYDAFARRLVCASCNPTGARPQAAKDHFGDLVGRNENWEEGQPLAGVIPGWTPYTPSASLYQPRYLSDSGRLLFDSNDALVPQDVNGTEDVYEYELPGVGDCTTSSVTFGARSGGCVGLISSGASAEESAFLDASESDSDVFFMTTAKLSSTDFDSSYDIYDAHECTGASPCVAQPPVPPPPCSTGDACKVAPSPQPSVFGSPASSTFAGAGNVVPESSKPMVVQRSLSRALKLARALKACRREKGRRRAACTRRARTRYAPKHANPVKTKKTGGR
jgi:hypothetical protein